jgi:hypothetical protein
VRRTDFVGNALRKIGQHDLALGAGDRTRCEVLLGGALLIPEYRDCGRVGVRLRASALGAQQRPEEHAQRGNEQRPSEKPENKHQQRIPRQTRYAHYTVSASAARRVCVVRQEGAGTGFCYHLAADER